MADRGIHIVEIGCTLIVAATLGQQTQHPVRVCGSGTYDKFGLAALGEWTLDMTLGGKETDTQRAGHILVITLSSSDLKDRRQSAAILCRYRAFIQLHIGNHIGVKC